MQPDRTRSYRLGGIPLTLALAAGAVAAGAAGLAGGNWWLVLLALALASGAVGVVQRMIGRGGDGTA